ncbi:PLP-dependent transferase [bacterium]|nr:PLP-dependent transferase [bacterium]
MKKISIETAVVNFSKQFGEKGSLNVPIYQNSTFKQKIPGTWEEYTYTRTNNPTEEALRNTIAGLENAKYGIVFSSGLAAINAVTELLAPGDHIISTADIYGGTHRLFSCFTQKKNMSFSYVDTTNLAAVEEAINAQTKLIYVETPSNPLLSITDIAALSKLTKARGILLAIDNTMATPYLQRPLELGADLVIHSTSKYLSGHTNVIGGAVVSNNDQLLQELKFIHKAVGGSPAPFDCYLTMLGIKTLALRMKQHEANAQSITSFLKGHKKISRIYYPGLSEHPQHALAKQQMSGFGGIVSFEIDGDEAAAQRFIGAIEHFSLAVSFGSVASLIDYPAKMSHKEMAREERLQRGFSDSLIRLSVGIEKDTDLIADIGNALDKV